MCITCLWSVLPVFVLLVFLVLFVTLSSGVLQNFVWVVVFVVAVCHCSMQHQFSESLQGGKGNAHKNTSNDNHHRKKERAKQDKHSTSTSPSPFNGGNQQTRSELSDFTAKAQQAHQNARLQRQQLICILARLLR